MKWYVTIKPRSSWGDIVCQQGEETFRLHFSLKDNGEINFVSQPDQQEFDWDVASKADDVMLSDSPKVPAAIKEYMRNYMEELQLAAS